MQVCWKCQEEINDDLAACPYCGADSPSEYFVNKPFADSLTKSYEKMASCLAPYKTYCISITIICLVSQFFIEKWISFEISTWIGLLGMWGFILCMIYFEYYPLSLELVDNEFKKLSRHQKGKQTPFRDYGTVAITFFVLILAIITVLAVIR